MKISKKSKDHPPKVHTPPSSLYFPYCCPQKSLQVPQQQIFTKKAHKFINLTLLKQNAESHVYVVSNTKEKMHQQDGDNQEIQEFQSDKSDFLSIIRKFNPNPETQKDDHGQFKTLESSKDISSSLRSGENNLSNVLESLSNDMFSEMFVSSTIKGKILLSGSLGSISEVKSDMEISCPTESLVYGLHFTQDN